MPANQRSSYPPFDPRRRLDSSRPRGRDAGYSPGQKPVGPGVLSPALQVEPDFNRIMLRHRARQLAEQMSATFDFATFPIGLSWNTEKGLVDKRPLTIHGHHDASSDPVEIRRLFREHLKVRDGEFLGVGLYPGTGILVLDVDNLSTLDDWEEEWGRLPGRRVTTCRPTGGMHIYQRLPADFIVSNSSPWKHLGVDIRSAGGWVVAPGTFCPWGSWDWVEGTDFEDAPRWILDAVRKPPPLERFERNPAPLVETGGAPIVNGGRNEALYREARSMNRRGWGREAIFRALCVFNDHHCSPPHSESEVRRACDSAFERYEQGSSHRGGPDTAVSAWD